MYHKKNYDDKKIYVDEKNLCINKKIFMMMKKNYDDKKFM